jgi:hypothetical protein
VNKFVQNLSAQRWNDRQGGFGSESGFGGKFETRIAITSCQKFCGLRTCKYEIFNTDVEHEFRIVGISEVVREHNHVITLRAELIVNGDGLRVGSVI